MALAHKVTLKSAAATITAADESGFWLVAELELPVKWKLHPGHLIKQGCATGAMALNVAPRFVLKRQDT